MVRVDITKLPANVRHYQTTGFALTDDTYRSLEPDEGWEERTRDGHYWKIRELSDGSHLVVHPPTKWDREGNA